MVELWTETGGEKEYMTLLESKHEQEREILLGLKRCPVCGGVAMGYRFGIKGQGIWIGCLQTEECGRYIEWHKEGWSLSEVAREWNKRNSGISLLIRRVKKWIRDSIGAEGQWRRKEAKRKREEQKERAAKARAIILGETEKSKKDFIKESKKRK